MYAIPEVTSVSLVVAVAVSLVVSVVVAVLVGGIAVPTDVAWVVVTSSALFVVADRFGLDDTGGWVTFQEGN